VITAGGYVTSCDFAERRTYSFGAYELDENRAELRRDGKPVAIRRQSFLLLAYLIRQRPRAVSNEELLHEIWPGAHVGASTVRDAILAARRAIAPGDGAAPALQIENVRGLGYRCAGPVEEQPISRVHEPDPDELATPRAFIDREPEMAALCEACRDALRGERRVVLLHGPAGIGKTRTALELAREASALGFDVHWGRTHEGEGSPPLWLWIQVLQSWLEAHGRTALERIESGARLVAMLEGRSRPDAGTSDTVLGEASSRFRMLDQMRRFLHGAAARRPLLLVLDDLHRADSSSIELLVFATQHLLRARLLVVGTHRPINPGHGLGRVLREPGTRSIPLQGLTRSAVHRIVAQSQGTDPDEELVARIHSDSGGNPFFVAELARAYARVDRLAPAGAVSEIPPGVHDAVWARISECPDGCQQVLQAACLMGPELALPVLRDALGVGDAPLQEALREAEQHDLLCHGSGGYRFVHGIVRESLSARITTTDRMRLHQQIGMALEFQTAADPTRHFAELAVHFSECRALSCAQRAVSFSRRAAEVARNGFAYEEAADLYRRALRSLAMLDRADPALHASILIELADVLGVSGASLSECQSIFFEAIERARTASLPVLVAEAAQRSTCCLIGRGHLNPFLVSDPQLRSDRLRSALQEVYQEEQVKANPALHGKVLVALAHLLVMDREVDRSRALIDEVLERFADDLDVVLRIEPLHHLLLWDFRSSHAADHLRLSARLLDLAQRSGNRVFEVHARTVQVTLALQSGDRDSLDDAGRAMDELTRDISDSFVTYKAALLRALQAMLDGPLDHARRQVREAAEIGLRSMINPLGVSGARGVCEGWLAILGGRADVLLPHVEAYLAQHTNEASARLTLARIHLELGRDEAARRELRDFDKILETVPMLEARLAIAGSAAEMVTRLGERQAAQSLYSVLQPHPERPLTIGKSILCMGTVARPLASLSALLGSYDEAEALFARAADHATRLRTPVLQVLTEADRAVAFLGHPRASERRQAERLRRSARANAERLFMYGVVRRLDASAR
jgi:DNA-binding winged helix-turn-helix (wHTH) protein/tetratricopeptide (TPR) repeat protein